MPKTPMFLRLVALWQLKTPEREIPPSAPRFSNTKPAIHGSRQNGLQGCNLMTARSDDGHQHAGRAPCTRAGCPPGVPFGGLLTRQPRVRKGLVRRPSLECPATTA